MTKEAEQAINRQIAEILDNGQDCGCQGLPIDPPICSQECWDALLKPEVATNAK